MRPILYPVTSQTPSETPTNNGNDLVTVANGCYINQGGVRGRGAGGMTFDLIIGRLLLSRILSWVDGKYCIRNFIN